MSGRPSKILTEIHPNILSKQQMQIHQLAKQGYSNKEIAIQLNIKQNNVSTQLSRIRAKVSKLKFIYKVDSEAVQVSNKNWPCSPADELKKKIETDPGFIKMMRIRYGTNEEQSEEDKLRIASAGGEQKMLFFTRGRHIKMHSLAGKSKSMENPLSYSQSDKVVLKLTKEQRKLVKDYLCCKGIKPFETFWDDGTAYYLVSVSDLKNIKQIIYK
jgi:predicted DNA-binding protein YlxM (UPF0122 family)